MLALYERPERYERPVKQFLNGYLSENRMRPEAECAEVIRLFRSAAATLQAGVGSRAFRPVRALNAAVLDSTMVGMMTRLQQRPIEDINALGGAYDNLIVNPDYLGATTSSTAAEDTVKLRLRLAIGAFENVA